MRRVGHRVGPRRPGPAHAHVAAASPSHPQFVESSLAQASVPVFELRPVICDSQPAIRSALPGAPKPTTQRLLDALAGPAEARTTTPQVAAAVAPPPVSGFPELPTGGVPGGGGPPPILPPGGSPPPVLPPDIGPPPELPPGGGPPPVVIVPPGQPPVVPPDSPPPPILPPDSPPPPVTPPTAVPEPASWALLILGFFGLGGALRAHRRKLKTNL